MSLNRCEFIGWVGADPEVRRMSNGDAVVNLRIAVSDRWTDKGTGQKRERTTWVPIVIFNEGLGKVAEQYVRKGMLLFVSGEFSVRKWQDQQGHDRYSTEIVLNRFRGELQMLDSKGEGGGNGAGTYRDADLSEPDLDDSIPF